MFLCAVGIHAAACTAETSESDASRTRAALEGEELELPTPVVFDSDMDFDDTTALAYIVQEHKLGHVDLRAVTVTNNGAALPGRGLLFARCLMVRFGLPQIPVADGSPQGTNQFPAWVRFLIDKIISDTLADCQLTPAPSPQTAAELISSVVSRSERPVTVIATGPVTNLATAFRQLDAQVLNTRLGGVFLMGGGIEVSDGLLEPDPRFDGTQTVNFWVDPAGTQAVYDLAPIGRLTTVGHDATQFVPITFPFLDRLAASAVTAEASYVSALMSHPFVQAGLQQQPDAAFWWDPLTTVARARNSNTILDYSMKRIDIVEDGPSAGRTLEVGAQDSGRWTRVAMRAEQAAFESRFLDTLNGIDSGD